jgi:AraC-like DNA-binding protein
VSADFASRAMLGLLAQGLAMRGLTVPARVQQALRAPPGARVPLDLKRELVGAALRQGGWALLPQLGSEVAQLAGEPLGQALGAARDAADLLARWNRLERYVHSQHRVQVVGLQAQQAVLHHVVRGGDGVPPVAESLVVLGVIAALLQWRGLQGVCLETERGLGLLPGTDPVSLASLALATSAGLGPVRLRWRGAMQAPQPGPWWSQMAWPQPLPGRLQPFDLLSPPSLPELAAQLRLPPRSLQRQLALQGWHWRGLLAEARCRAATEQLLRGGESLAEVGFACGYADQAHLTRALRARSGLTPAAFRRSFAQPQG